MSKDIPRLRMFAGPNGSGKSTFKTKLSPEMISVYINPDEIQKHLQYKGFLNLTAYEVSTTEQEVLDFFHNSPILKTDPSFDVANTLRFHNEKLTFHGNNVPSYLASASADFIRQKLLESLKSFTFETVMSHSSKIELLQKAQAKGYRTYLYYVATNDPAINVQRVNHREKMGGHSVPEDKIIDRYHRSLDLLIEAVQSTHRAYIFDNSTFSHSTHEHTWLAEITNGHTLEMKTDQIPAWFTTALYNKFNNV